MKLNLNVCSSKLTRELTLVNKLDSENRVVNVTDVTFNDKTDQLARILCYGSVYGEGSAYSPLDVCPDLRECLLHFEKPLYI